MRWILAGLGVAALVGYLLTGLAQIRPDERAVVKRFGRIVAYPGPGLWVGLPWGIDRIERVPIRTVRQVKVGYVPEASTEPNAPIVGQYLTGDSNLVNVELTVNYDVRDEDTQLERFVTEQARVETLIVRATETALAQWIATHSVDDVLLTGNARLPGALVPRVQRLLDPYRTGVRIAQVSVSYLAPPDDVRPDFDRVNQAQARIRTLQEQARTEAARRLATAETVRRAQEADTAAYRYRKLELAKTDAALFLERLASYQTIRKTNPNILQILWWEEIGQTLLGMQRRGRISPLDQFIGPDGLDLSTFESPPRLK